MSTPRKLSDILHPAIEVESQAAHFLLGLELSNPTEKDIRRHIAASLIESALMLRHLDREGLRVERRSNRDL